MVKPYCGLCGKKRISLYISQDKRCNNPYCDAYAIELWIDEGYLYNSILNINRLANIQ